jgi:signal recognition particle GTPase
MGEWKTVYEDEVEERWVTVKVYESEDDEDEDEGPVVRVTAAPIEDDEGGLEQNKNVLKPEAKAADRSITLEPDPVEDLEEELIEVGFSPEAAAWIVRKVPE